MKNVLDQAQHRQIRKNKDNFLIFQRCGPHQFLMDLQGVFRRDISLYFIILIYIVAGIFYVARNTGLDAEPYRAYAPVWRSFFLFYFPLLFVAVGISRIALGIDGNRWRALQRGVSSKCLARFVGGTVLIMALMFFQATFTLIKNALSKSGFVFDVALSDIDRFIHFGIDPWITLHSADADGSLLPLVEFNYGPIWTFLCYGVLYWVIMSEKTAEIRFRYVASFMLVWIVLGNILAGLFISAGPAFFGRVTGDHERFSDLFTMLLQPGGPPSYAVKLQDYLWSLHAAGNAGLGSGISAFPSVHLGIAALNALFACEHSRILGVVAITHASTILLGSVYLGWHYAIDGYMAICVTCLIYWYMRFLLKSDTERGRGTSIHT